MRCPGLTGRLVSWLLSLSVVLVVAVSEPHGHNQHLTKFFHSVDRDGDGQIEPHEAVAFIGDHFGDVAEQDVHQSINLMKNNLDSSDQGQTISQSEVAEHLHSLLQGNRVSEWVKHAVGLPQYVQAFRQNSITSLDFPTLVSDGGLTLESDLGVASKLHRQQIIRAIKRIILGLGEMPSPPLNMSCTAVACNAAWISWARPERLGHPPLHKYKLERWHRLPGSGEGGKWETVHGDLDGDELSYQDEAVESGEYIYRLSAWNAYGWSQYATSGSCFTSAKGLPCRSRQPSGASSQRMPNWLLSMMQAVGLAVLISTGMMQAARRSKAVRTTLFRVLGHARSIRKRPGHGMTGMELSASGELQGLYGNGNVADTASPRPRQPASMLADLTPGERAALLHGASSRPRHSGAEAADGKAGGDLASCSSKAWRDGQPSSGHLDSHPSMSASMHGRSRLQAGEGMGLQQQQVEEDAIRSISEVRPSEVHHRPTRSGSHMVRVATERSYNSAGAAEHAATNPATLGSHASGRSLPGLTFTQSGSGRALQAGSPAGSDASKVDMWLRGSSARPLLVDAEEESVDLEVPPTPHHVDRNKCAQRGCTRKFNWMSFADMKHSFTRHYCSICQNVYCQKHTRYSPHGNLGSCGMESKCICQTCFLALPKASQERLERSNKLRHSGSDPNLRSLKSGANSRASSVSTKRSGPATGRRPSQTAAQAALTSPPSSSPSASTSLVSEQERRGPQQRWALARNSFEAAHRFRTFGRLHRQRMSGQLPPLSNGTLQQHSAGL